MGIPCGVILNRADVGDKKVQAYLQSEGIPLLMEIPFDRKIAEGYAQGQSLVEIHPELKEKFQKLFQEIKGK